MKSRKHVPYKAGRRDFTRTARATHRKNVMRVQARGGIRL